jgi:hypothetical protein
MLFSSPFAIAIAKLSDYFIEQLASGIQFEMHPVNDPPARSQWAVVTFE